MKVPFFSLEKMHAEIKDELATDFAVLLDTNSFILGESLKKFERNFAKYLNVKYAIGTSNGLDAIFLSLKALDIGAGDEVILPSNTFIATALAITYSGADIILVEPNIETYNICPINIEDAITSKTKAIICVHLYGQPCGMDSLLKISKKYNIPLIEDNAQAQGAEWNSQKTGTFGIINATSFYPTKNLGALGDGGAITTNDQTLSEKVMSLRNYGSSKKYNHEIVGYNKRLDECQAYFLNTKLKYLEKWNAERNAIAKLYSEKLKNTGDLILPKVMDKAKSVYHLYVFRTKRRNQLKEFLFENGIGCQIHYPIPIHLQKCYSDFSYRKGDFPIAEEIAQTCLSLPIYPGLLKKEIDHVTHKIKLYFANNYS